MKDENKANQPYIEKLHTNNLWITFNPLFADFCFLCSEHKNQF